MTGDYWGPILEWQGKSQCRGLVGNSDGGAAALRDCMRLGKGGQMFRGMSQWWWWCQGSGWCHAGVAAVGVSLGWPWGPCCSEGCPAMLPCPAAGRGGAGSWAEGSCSRHVSLLRKTMQGKDHHPGGVSKGGLGGAHRNLSLTPSCSAAPRPLWPAPAAPPKPPGMPIPLHAVCLKLGLAHVLGASRGDRQKGQGAAPVPVLRQLQWHHWGKTVWLVLAVGWGRQGPVPPTPSVTVPLHENAGEGGDRGLPPKPNLA